MRLEGKVALITGGARGIGAASAERYIEEGAKVVIADRRADEAEALAVQLNQQQANSALAIELDVSDEAAWTDAVKRTINTFGKLNILVNNAGIIRVLPLEKTDLEIFTKVINTNLVGTFLGIKAVMETMKVNGGGSIVNFLFYCVGIEHEINIYNLILAISPCPCSGLLFKSRIPLSTVMDHIRCGCNIKPHTSRFRM